MRKAEPLIVVNFVNNSDIPFQTTIKAEYDIEGYPLGQVKISPHDTTKVLLKAVWKYPEETRIKVTVENVLVSPDAGLATEFILSTEGKK